jgi:hypothetical protein
MIDIISYGFWPAAKTEIAHFSICHRGKGGADRPLRVGSHLATSFLPGQQKSGGIYKWVK